MPKYQFVKSENMLIPLDAESPVFEEEKSQLLEQGFELASGMIEAQTAEEAESLLYQQGQISSSEVLPKSHSGTSYSKVLKDTVGNIVDGGPVSEHHYRLFCHQCKAVTKHIAIEYEETPKWGKSKHAGFLGVLFSLIDGLSTMIMDTGMDNRASHKCSQCGNLFNGD
ncbi:hypothetical protein GCE9029_03490 [Grimontia celer]|uniref:Uncharacterized protein n=1 Tax=Grimontia celer TaxID=1796497 RepID=A0A128F7U4_9GAMM|nr:hypothetical protein [Grimontia celer]CZF82867.1 hypothetical protein GCE9029_03490 [Grimontia celer]